MLSYKILRRLIGILGISLPFLCIIGGLLSKIPLNNSISDYYYTNLRDLFVGILFVTGAFMTSYRGYEIIDTIVNSVSGFCALLISLFPCDVKDIQHVGIFQLSPEVSNIVHSSAAILFFTTLFINSTFLFTLSNNYPTVQKLKRNIVYRVCGIIIFLCAVMIVIFRSFEYVIIVTETIALVSFGISWLVKGETFFIDEIK